ncbi:MAG: hypothetical protein MUE59_15505, partial [Thiobacillaceae bacterium]|nr:hypothetical protein [Thiobacillaceae bacterium]
DGAWLRAHSWRDVTTVYVTAGKSRSAASALPPLLQVVIVRELLALVDVKAGVRLPPHAKIRSPWNS